MGRYEYCDTTIDMLIEKAIEQEWKEENAELAQPLNTVNKDSVLNAWAILDVMQDINYEEVLARLKRAAEQISNTPEADRILSIYDELVSIRESINDIKETLDKNWRER